MIKSIVSAVLLSAALAACGGSDTVAVSNKYAATLNGANETPAVTTDGSGTATLTVNGGTVTYTVNITGLSAAPLASHLHLGAAGVAGGVVVPFKGLPTTATGTFTGTFTEADIKPSTSPAVTTLADLIVQMRAGKVYVNVHTSNNQGGEIRGQVAVQ